MKTIAYKSDGTKETGAKIIKKLESMGNVRRNGCYGDSLGSIYYIQNGVVRWDYSECINPNDYTILDINEPEELEFPRVMDVWNGDNEANAQARVVFEINPILKHKYIGYSNCERIEDIKEGEMHASGWKHAKEITPVELTPLAKAKVKLKELHKLLDEI